jgi:hypothetical protein
MTAAVCEPAAIATDGAYRVATLHHIETALSCCTLPHIAVELMQCGRRVEEGRTQALARSSWHCCPESRTTACVPVVRTSINLISVHPEVSKGIQHANE